MTISKFALIMSVAFIATSCDFKEMESLLLNANSNEISFECSNETYRNRNNTDAQDWEVVLDLDLGTGNYSRIISELVSEIKTIERILVTPKRVDGYDEKDSQVFSMTRKELVITIYENDSIADHGNCEIVNKKYNRKF